MAKGLMLSTFPCFYVSCILIFFYFPSLLFIPLPHPPLPRLPSPRPFPRPPPPNPPSTLPPTRPPSPLPPSITHQNTALECRS